MFKTLKAGLATAAAAALLCSPALSFAALTPIDLALPVVDTAASVAPLLNDDEPRLFTQAALKKPLAMKLRGQSDLALWNLVATVQAQQKNNVFDLVDASKKTVWEFEREKVSAVPLPGVVWLFVMAVLGLAGTRVKGVVGTARKPQSAQPFGLATA
ncbi:MAG: hypothetical protein H7Y33_07480 [Cytophagales bacterium]|nr:hypothetical protein [Rhizobacter sp.]